MGENYFVIKERYNINEISKILGVGRPVVERHVTNGTVKEEEVRRKDNKKIKDISITALARLYEDKYGSESKRLGILKEFVRVIKDEGGLEKKIADEKEAYFSYKTYAKMLCISEPSVRSDISRGNIPQEDIKYFDRVPYISESRTKQELEKRIKRTENSNHPNEGLLGDLHKHLRNLVSGKYPNELKEKVPDRVSSKNKERAPKQKVLERISIDIRFHYQ